MQYRISPISSLMLMFSLVLFIILTTLPESSHASDTLVPFKQKVNVHENTRALTATLHVSPDGDCKLNDNCYSTIQAAINYATTGCTDPCTIRVGEGTYSEHPTLNSAKEVILDGGWNFTTGSHTPGATKIKDPSVNSGSIKLRVLNVIP